MKQIIHAKHWQVFLLFIGLPMVAQIIMISTASVGSLSVGIVLSLAAGILSMGVYFLWLWSVGNFLYKHLPDHISMNVQRFRAFLIFQLTYIGMMFFVTSMILSTYLSTIGNVASTGFIGLFVLLHLFAMFCIFYSFYFIAKTLKSIELNRKATFGDYAGEFFLIWFFFIGIWIIQPRINKLAMDSPQGLEDHLVE